MKHLLVVGAWGVLERGVAAIAEGPGPGNGEALGGCFLKCGRDFGLLRGVGPEEHQPVGIEAVAVEWATVEHEVQPAGRNKPIAIRSFCQ